MEKKAENKGPGADVAVIGKKTALDILASRLDLTPTTLKETLKATVFSLCKDDAQFTAAVVVANTYGLNPLLKEMTAFPGKSGGVIPVVMIDGWIKLVNRNENYNGVELIENKTANGQPNKSDTTVESVTAKFYLKDREHPVVVTEYMEECFDISKEPWKRWPRRMLRHKAYIQGARIAFGFSGIYDEDEKDRIIEAESTVIVEPVIGLKGQEQAGQQAGPGQEVPIEAAAKEEWLDVGDLNRFGQAKKNNATFMVQNLETCAKKIGKEEFMKILGDHGVSSLQEILKFEDLTKLTNAVLDAAKKKDQ